MTAVAAETPELAGENPEATGELPEGLKRELAGGPERVTRSARPEEESMRSGSATQAGDFGGTEQDEAAQVSGSVAGVAETAAGEVSIPLCREESGAFARCAEPESPPPESARTAGTGDIVVEAGEAAEQLAAAVTAALRPDAAPLDYAPCRQGVSNAVQRLRGALLGLIRELEPRAGTAALEDSAVARAQHLAADIRFVRPLEST